VMKALRKDPAERFQRVEDLQARLVDEIRSVEAALGDGKKIPAPSESANINVVRRSLHAAKRLGKGHALEASDCIALRPGGGISPAKLGDLVGRRVVTDVEEGRMLTMSDFG